MKTFHSTFPLAAHAIHQIDFDPKTFSDASLLWLPHHHKLTHAGRKRKAEHLAGRLAAFHALQQHNLRLIPDIGEARQPLWPDGFYGSISHCGTTAVAVVSQEPIGVDLETCFSEAMCTEVADSITTPEEQKALNASGLPFPLALTLAFSAKESAFKAFSFMANGLPGFASAQIISLDTLSVTLELNALFSPQQAGQHFHLVWLRRGQNVVTLLTKALQPA
ncbi:enterobactin synthase subunit EntD [Enterobacteriaceae bacterium C23F]